MDRLIQIKIVPKNPNILKVSTPHGTNQSLNGCKSITVSFSDAAAANIAAISFTNRYCGILTIAARYKIETEHSGESFKFAWKRLVDCKKLMPHPHFSTGAESSFIIRSSEFLNEAKHVSSLKFVLQQPSVQFTEFNIEDIKVYSEDSRDCRKTSLPEWLVSKTQSEKKPNTVAANGFSVDSISQTMQKMWALARKSQHMNEGEKVRPERFDKDGFYEINLLSYQWSVVHFIIFIYFYILYIYIKSKKEK